MHSLKRWLVVLAGVALLSLAGVRSAGAVSASALSKPWSSFRDLVYPMSTPGTETFAFYYPWYAANNWDGRLLQMNPSLGRYDSRHANIINQHMVWAERAHLGGLIVSWWGRTMERGVRIENLMPTLLNAAGAKNLRLVLMIEQYPGRTPATVAADIASCISRYTGYPGWYLSDRPTPFLDSSLKPVFYIDRPHNGQGLTPAAWTAALDQIHQQSGAVVLAHSYDTRWVTDGHFDGLWDYSYTNTFDVRNAGMRLPDHAWYVPTAIPGFDARRSKNWTKVIPRAGGAFYNKTWGDLLGHGIDMPMASVTSFNEWFETTQIEPCAPGFDRDGFAYETYSPVSSTFYLDKTAYWADKLLAYKTPDVRSALTTYIRFNTTNRPYGIFQNDWGSDGNTEVVTLGSKPARRPKLNNKYLYLQVHKKFIAPVATPIQVRVDYFDSGVGQIWVQYNGALSVAQNSLKLNLTNTNTWRTALFVIPDAILNGKGNGWSDLRLAATTGLRPGYSLVAVTKL